MTAPHAFLLLFLSAGLLVSHPARAADFLFEDRFGRALSSQETSADFNLDLEARQSGSLSPVPYAVSEDLEPWQIQITPHNGTMLFMLYLRPKWMGLAPSWELQKDDGDYCLNLEMGFSNPGAAPARIAVALGHSSLALQEIQDPDLFNGLAVSIEDGADPMLRVFQGGNQLAATSFSPNKPNQFTLTLRWNQRKMQIKDLEILIDGNKIDMGTGVGMELQSRRVLLAAKGRMQGPAIPGFRLDRLSYSKE